MWQSSIFLLASLLSGLTGQDPLEYASNEVVPDRGVEWIDVEGTVEIDRLKALESAEAQARLALWERFAPVWRRHAGMLVPEQRVEHDLRAWIEREFEDHAPVHAKPVQVFASSVGEAYRKAYRIQVAGPEAEAFRRAGEVRATELSHRFKKSVLLMALLVGCLLWGASRMDRLTRGYLTWRIRLVSLALAGSGIFVLYPHH